MNHDRTSAGLASTNKNSLKCGVLNTRSIRNKLTDFQVLLTSNDLDLFAVTESWLTSEDSSATEKLAGISDAELLADLPYTCYRTDRADGRKGGGVLLVVKNSCMTSRRCDLERATLEMVVTEIQSANSTVIAAVFYRPQDSSDRFFDEFEAFLNSVETTEGNKKTSHSR